MTDIPAISAQSLGKIYYLGVRRRPVQALHDVSFQVKRGEVFAFLGANGAGKTTTIKLLLDHARPSSGRCSLFGIDSRIPGSRARVGYMPDLPNFYRFLTAAELLEYMGRLHGLKPFDRKGRIHNLLELVQLKGRESEPLKGYSRGMLQRVALAQALIGNPDLLILDEPLGGLDPLGRYEFHSIIKKLKTEGHTIFFSSHILEDAEKIADQVGIIHQGTLVASGTLPELIGNQSGYDVEIIYFTENIELRAVVEAAGGELSTNNSTTTVSLPDETAVRQVMRLASEGKIKVTALNPKKKTLEEVFILELEKWKR